jgi:hypothetical protein
VYCSAGSMSRRLGLVGGLQAVGERVKSVVRTCLRLSKIAVDFVIDEAITNSSSREQIIATTDIE